MRKHSKRREKRADAERINKTKHEGAEERNPWKFQFKFQQVVGQDRAPKMFAPFFLFLPVVLHPQRSLCLLIIKRRSKRRFSSEERQEDRVGGSNKSPIILAKRILHSLIENQ